MEANNRQRFTKIERSFYSVAMKRESPTKQRLMEAAQAMYARNGYDGLSMRALAKQADISLSVIYHHFPDKDYLLECIFIATNTRLGAERSRLANGLDSREILDQRLTFQFEHMQDIVFVLKYYLHFRDRFTKQAVGWVPPKTSLHIEEFLLICRDRGELRADIDITTTAKVITHTVNGYLLEYFPHQPNQHELGLIRRDLSEFVWRSITPAMQEVPMS